MKQSNIQLQIKEKFGHHLRMRPCGILIHDEQLLLIKHIALNKKGIFWSPPGGGLQFGENIDECLKREFLEETGLEINVGQLIGIYEYLQLPLHAVELFFQCTTTSIEALKLGIDPELSDNQQIISDIKWFTVSELQELSVDTLHPVLHGISSYPELLIPKGRLNKY